VTEARAAVDKVEWEKAMEAEMRFGIFASN